MLASLAIAAVLWSGDAGSPVVPRTSRHCRHYRPCRHRPHRPHRPTVPWRHTGSPGLSRREPARRPPSLPLHDARDRTGAGGRDRWYLRHGTDGRWERALEWRAWKRKFLADDVTFDGDHFNTNAIGHPIDGAAYYQIARGNGLGPGGSFVSSVLASRSGSTSSSYPNTRRSTT